MPNRGGCPWGLVLMTCPCNRAFYCSKKCQKGHWKQHKRQHQEPQAANTDGAFDAKPSDLGSAANCRHGGPPPAAGNTMAFITAMIESHQIMIPATNQVRVMIQNNVEGVVRRHAIQTELTILLEFWIAPQHARLIDSESYKVAFSCATDAVIDGDFPMARLFVRTGAFLQLAASEGVKNVSAVLRSANHEEGGLAVFCECLHKTNTDRGCTLYLSKEIPCRCLRLHAAEHRSQPQMGYCANCETQKPKAELRKCSQCKTVSYCNQDCQKADWSQHRKICSAACRSPTRRETFE